MAPLPRLLLLLTLAGCGLSGTAPPMMGANEMQERPGLFTGPTGSAVLSGPQTFDPVAPAEPGATPPETETGTG